MLPASTHTLQRWKGAAKSQILSRVQPLVCHSCTLWAHACCHAFPPSLFPPKKQYYQDLKTTLSPKAFKSKLHWQNFGLHSFCLAPETRTSSLLFYPVFQLSGLQVVQETDTEGSAGFPPLSAVTDGEAEAAAFREIKHLPEMLSYCTDLLLSAALQGVNFGPFQSLGSPSLVWTHPAAFAAPAHHKGPLQVVWQWFSPPPAHR